MEDINAPSASVKFFDGQFNLLNNNKRLVVVIEEKYDDDDGIIQPLRVAMVIVGGVGVNTITYDDITGKAIQKGDELSTFRAGGRYVLVDSPEFVSTNTHISSFSRFVK